MEILLLENYRPISRRSVTAKVFESLVNEQIKDFLSANDFESDTIRLQKGPQYGNCSYFCNKYLCCAAVSVDVSKAFDSEPWPSLTKPATYRFQ